MMSPVGILTTEKDKMKEMKRKETEEKTEERQRIPLHSLRAGDGVKEGANQANRARGLYGSCGLAVSNEAS